jgi:hypothetical protein
MLHREQPIEERLGMTRACSPSSETVRGKLKQLNDEDLKKALRFGIDATRGSYFGGGGSDIQKNTAIRILEESSYLNSSVLTLPVERDISTVVGLVACIEALHGIGNMNGTDSFKFGETNHEEAICGNARTKELSGYAREVKVQLQIRLLEALNNLTSLIGD